MGRFLAVASFYNNTDEHVEQTFKNVLSQTHQDWLLIVGDDMSDDPEFKRRLKKRVEQINDPRILYYQVEQKRELYLYQNMFRYHEYDYYFDLDVDDVIDPMLFELYDRHFTQYPEVNSIFCDFNVVDETGALEQFSFVQEWDDYRNEWLFRHHGSFDQIYQNRATQKMFGVARAMRRPDVDAIPIVKNCRTATDTLFLFWNLTRGKHLQLPRRLYSYINRDGSDSSSMSSEDAATFNLNAKQHMDQYVPNGKTGIYEDIWHITSAINATDWLDQVSGFSVWSDNITEEQKDKVRFLYPDKEVVFNEYHRNQIIPWDYVLDRSNLKLKYSNKLSILCLNENYGTHINIDEFQSINDDKHREIEALLPGVDIKSYYFFRQARFIVNDDLDETIDKPRTIAILVDSIKSQKEVDRLVRTVNGVNATEQSKAYIIEINPGMYSEELRATLGETYFTCQAKPWHGESLRRFLEQKQPDLLYWNRVSNLLHDSTKNWLLNNYWHVVSPEELNDANFGDDFSMHCLQTPIKEVPKCRFYYRNGPELHCDWADHETHEAQFWYGDTMYWKHQLITGLWARYSQDWWSDWECRIIEKASKQVLYVLKPDQSHFGVQVDSGSLGDTLSWMGQIEELNHQRDFDNISVRTHKSFLFDWQYYNQLNINEVDWKGQWPQNHQGLGVYIKDGNVSPKDKHKRDWRTVPLGAIAADLLGISYLERKPRLAPEFYQKSELTGPAVTIATNSTAQAKYWNHPTGWQDLVNKFNERGIKVYYVSKEKTDLNGVTHVPDLLEAAQHIRAANKFIGISSGLSWLAWALDVDVCMISGFTWEFVEFDCSVRIINKSVCSGCWTWAEFDRGDWNWCPQFKNTTRHFECTKTITPEYVEQELETAGWFNI
jgi:autotransporter strand-loop-strand O-heptosyltransferase